VVTENRRGIGIIRHDDHLDFIGFARKPPADHLGNEVRPCCRVKQGNRFCGHAQLTLNFDRIKPSQLSKRNATVVERLSII